MENGPSFNLSKVIEDAISVITQPVDFYRNTSKSGGFADPAIFVIVIAVIAALIFSIFSLFGGGRFAAAGLALLIIMPIMMLISTFIYAAIMFIIWKLMGSENNYETAYRCVAYSSAIFPIVALITLIPYLGSIIGVLWGMYLMVIASTEVHELNKNTALIVFGILGFIGVIMNISSERAARNMEQQMGKFEKQMGKSMEDMSDMTPEEAGKAVGEFLRGFEEATKKSQ